MPRRVLRVVGATVGRMRFDLHFLTLLRWWWLVNGFLLLVEEFKAPTWKRAMLLLLHLLFHGDVLLVGVEELPRRPSRMTRPLYGLAYGTERGQPPDPDELDREAPHATRVGARVGSGSMRCSCGKYNVQRGRSPWIRGR
jgi:hypothetical protein